MCQSPFPSSSGLEGPMYQAEFFSPFPISLKVPGQWAPFSLLYQPWRSQAPRLWWHHHKTGKCGRTQSTVYKTKQLWDQSGTWTTVAAGQQNAWSPSGQEYFHHHLLLPSSEWVIRICPHFYYIDTTSQVLRFDPFCRASRWLGTISQPVLYKVFLSYIENCDMLILIIKILFSSGHRIVCYANHKILFQKIKL